MNYLTFDPVCYWCAGCWVSGLTKDTIGKVTKEQIIKGVANCEQSVVIVSVSVEEKEVMAQLKEWGFVKGKWFKNWGHGGKKTCLYTLQISKKEWVGHGNKVGAFDDDDWY